MPTNIDYKKYIKCRVFFNVEYIIIFVHVFLIIFFTLHVFYIIFLYHVSVRLLGNLLLRIRLLLTFETLIYTLDVNTRKKLGPELYLIIHEVEILAKKSRFINDNWCESLKWFKFYAELKFIRNRKIRICIHIKIFMHIV